MNPQHFDASQLQRLQAVFQLGSADASQSLETWLGCHSLVTVESVDQMPLSDATQLLGGETPACFGTMQVPEPLSGLMLFGFDDASGLALADLAIAQPRGTSQEWGELEVSAALESTNILCCAYLNRLTNAWESSGLKLQELVPLPPQFHRDFAASVLEFAFMGQAIESDYVFLIRTKFQMDGEALNWTLLWIPTSGTLQTLQEIL